MRGCDFEELWFVFISNYSDRNISNLHKGIQYLLLNLVRKIQIREIPITFINNIYEN